MGPTSYRVDTGKVLVDLEVERVGGYERRLTLNGRRYRVVAAVLGPVHTVEVDGVSHTFARDEGGVVRSPAPAVIVSLPVSVGDEVAAGDPLIVLESMKMESVVEGRVPGPGERAAW